MWIFVLFVALSLKMVAGLKQNLTCLSSTPEITKIFDFHNDNKNLWENSSLPLCNPTDLTSFKDCCPDIHRSISSDVVYILCHNLTGNELLKMEGLKGKLPFNKTDCPTLPAPPGSSTPPPGESEGKAGHWEPATIIFASLIILAIIIIIIGVVYKRRKSPANRNHGSERGPADKWSTNGHCGTETENETSIDLLSETGNGWTNGHCGTETENETSIDLLSETGNRWTNGHCGTENETSIDLLSETGNGWTNGHCGTETENETSIDLLSETRNGWTNGHCGTETENETSIDLLSETRNGWTNGHCGTKNVKEEVDLDQ